MCLYLLDYIYQHEIGNINADNKMFLKKFENDFELGKYNCSYR